MAARFKLAFACTLAFCAAAPRSAAATYSIVATDTASREVGGAGTSCVAPTSVDIIHGSAPGFGVVAAQASFSQAGREEAVRQLRNGVAPEQIIQSITSSQFDFGSASRQYGIVDLQARAAGFTGANTISYAEDRQGSAGTFTYSVQGNILTGAAVLDQAASAFETSGCDLADKLMRSLEAGADNGEGDSRCTPRGIPSNSAYIQVDRENDQPGAYLRLRHTNTSTSTQNPISALRAQYDTWRQSNPCPVGTGGTGGAAGASGTAGSGGAPSSGGSGGAPGSGGTSAGATGGAAGTGGTSAAGGSGAAGGTPGSGGSGDDGGCACSLPARAATNPSAWLLLAVAAGWARRRRRFF
jgi:MYXO-CTERM domain-containing protein